MTTIVCVPGARHGGPWGTRLRTTTHRVRTPVLPGFGDPAHRRSLPVGLARGWPRRDVVAGHGSMTTHPYELGSALGQLIEPRLELIETRLKEAR